VPFLAIKNKALGKKYNLSLVFVGNTRSQRLNQAYRGKNKPTNVLSFELDKTHGEIFIAPGVARKQAPSFERNFDNFIAFLFIHGLMHLKGMDHGSTMEKAEEKLRKQFGI
jgi:probable rRNA maturation factor